MSNNYAKKKQEKNIFLKFFNKVLKRIYRRDFHFSRTVMNQHIKGYIQGKQVYGCILDVGGGANQELYQNNFKEYISINIDPEVKSTYTMDSNYMDFADEKFDAVICMQVLEHVQTPQKTLSEIYRVLKQKGTLIISVPFLVEVHNFPGDYWRFSISGIEQILKECGFKNIQAYSWGNKQSVIAYLKYKGWITSKKGKKLTSISNDERYPLVVWAYAEK
jgi:SAM-dependent methyltransferase